MTANPKTLEGRLRRKARRQGLRLKKVRKEYTGQHDGLEYMVTDPCGHVEGYFHTRSWHDPMAALEGIERWLDAYGPN